MNYQKRFLTKHLKPVLINTNGLQLKDGIHIRNTWVKYVEKHSDQGPQKYKGIRFDKESKKWRGSFKYEDKTYNIETYYSQDKAKEELDKKMIEIIGYIPIDDKRNHKYIDKTDTNKYKFRKNNKSKTFNTLIEALCYKYIILLKIKINITTEYPKSN